MRVAIAILLMLFTLPALANVKGPLPPPPVAASLPDANNYWRQLYASQAQQLVDMARQFDAANAKIEQLQKEIDELKKKVPSDDRPDDHK